MDESHEAGETERNAIVTNDSNTYEIPHLNSNSALRRNSMNKEKLPKIEVSSVVDMMCVWQLNDQVRSTLIVKQATE